jgi:hypothetical protein
LAIRHLERMADHATNIGQRVTYIVTGHRHWLGSVWLRVITRGEETRPSPYISSLR